MERLGGMAVKKLTSVLVAGILAAPLPASAQTANVVGNGQADMTVILQAVINATPPGGTLVLPPGHYKLSATLLVTKPITIVGSGFGTQLYELSNVTLLQLKGVNAATISNLYLGSAATAAGTSLLELTNSNHNRIDNVTMLGSYYGVHLAGSLLNTFVDLRSGTNFQGFYGATSANQYWVYGEASNGYSANANTFVAPVLEGGANGIYLTDNNSQGSLTIVGGTIEGVSGTGLTFANTFIPSFISGTDMEANGAADIAISGSSNISISTVNATNTVTINASASFLSKNILIGGGVVNSITVGSGTSRVTIENVTTGLDAACSGITNNNANATTLIVQVAKNCANQ